MKHVYTFLAFLILGGLNLNAQQDCTTAVTVFPYEESFDNPTLPACWNQETITDNTNWTFNSSDNSSDNSSYNSSYAMFFIDNNSTPVTKLITRRLNLSNLAHPTLTFSHEQKLRTQGQGGNTFQDELRVFYKTSLNGEWTSIESYTANIAPFEVQTIDLPNPSDDYYIAFEATAKRGNGVKIDNVKIEDTGRTYTYDELASAENPWTSLNPNEDQPTEKDQIIIKNGNAVLTTNTTIKKVTVEPGAGLTINATLTVKTQLILESVSDSYSSLILNGTIDGTGTVKYKRHVNKFANSGATTGNNDLISAPVTSHTSTFLDFRNANPDLMSGTIGGELSYLFGPFDNTTNQYINYTASNDAYILKKGIGYRTASNQVNGSTFTFEGEVLKENVSVPITVGEGSYWNLIGNPYPSYINSYDFLIQDENMASLHDNAKAIYGYDGTASDGWIIINLNNYIDHPYIAPGQGFLVAAQADSNILFTPEMREISGGDDFIAGRSSEQNAFLRLKLEGTTFNYHTDFYFNSNSTRSLDPGYDAGILDTNLPNSYIYSHLVDNNEGRGMAIQSLGEEDIESVTIPLGVHANQGEQLTFSISEHSLPSGTQVYLFDSQTNTTVLLNTGDYVLSPSNHLTGTGRFYLNLSNTTLSTPELSLEHLNIYSKPNEKRIVISGRLLEDTTANLYDLQGRKVSRTLLDTHSNSQSIDVSHLSTGVYVVQIINGQQNKTQKVIIK